MICWHEKYNLGDKHSFKSGKELFEHLLQQANIKPEEIGVDMDNFESSKGKLLEELRKHIPIIPLFLYDGKFPEMTTASERQKTKGVRAKSRTFFRTPPYNEEERKTGVRGDIEDLLCHKRAAIRILGAYGRRRRRSHIFPAVRRRNGELRARIKRRNGVF